ncbi:HNH endonuclease [Nostoc sp.]|uniref:HNH endonuclease n=1 Tax=Nostoc sp. TaxID=1180 RepID=UPI003FA58759
MRLNHRYKKVAKSGCRYNQKVKDIRGWQVDIPKSKGVRNDYKNLQLLHRHCHDMI